MARLFISYSRTDEVFARRLAADLADLGADIWIDVEDIPAGMNWSSAIQEGLDSCEAMLVIISPDSMASRNVENEWQYVLDHGYPIIPVLWQPARVHFQLHRLQYIDFHGQDYDSALRQLHSELRRNGITLDPLMPADDSVPVPARRPPPMPDGVTAGLPRSYLVIGVAVIAVLALALILALSGVLDGDGAQEEEPGVAITFPTENLVVEGVVPVRGITVVPDFSQYEILYGVGHDPQVFGVSLITRDIPVTTHNTLLGQLDTSALANGDYTIRLMVTDTHGGIVTEDVHITVNNPAPTAVPTPAS